MNQLGNQTSPRWGFSPNLTLTGPPSMLDSTPGLRRRATCAGTNDVIRVIDPFLDGRFYILTLNNRGVGANRYLSIEAAQSYADHEYRAVRWRRYPVPA